MRQVTRSLSAKSSGEFFEAKGIKAETRKAVGLPIHKEEDGDDDIVWIPKSQADILEDNDGKVYIYLERWMSAKKQDKLARLKK